MLSARCGQTPGSALALVGGKQTCLLFLSSLLLALPVLMGTLVFLSPSLAPSLSALTLIKNVISGQLWIWVSSS